MAFENGRWFNDVSCVLFFFRIFMVHFIVVYCDFHGIVIFFR